MARTIAEIEADLLAVRECIARQLAGDVSYFAHEGGDTATMIPLNSLIAREAALLRQLGAAKRATYGRFQAGKLLD
jgi:hypothetical protein